MGYYGLIYQFEDTTNGMVYIGKTKRTRDFLSGDYIGSGKRYRNARNAHGADKFIPTILEWVDGEIADLNAAERRHIKDAKERIGEHMLYNLTEGGDGGNTTLFKEWNEKERREHSELVKQKMAELPPERRERNRKIYTRVSNEYWSTRSKEQKKSHMERAYSKRKKSYIATHEDGTVLRFTGLNEFCRSNSFSRRIAREMAEGRRTEPNRGWSIVYAS